MLYAMPVTLAECDWPLNEPPSVKRIPTEISCDLKELAMAPPYISSVRISPDNETVLDNLGLLAELAGNWHGKGFNLIARPDKTGNANLFLELNQTSETLKFDPISSPIPNRGFVVDDIELFGLTYLQKISDTVTGGALHIEPGIWITLPKPTDPTQPQSVARMGTIPHGNALLAQGTARSVPLTGGTFQIPPVTTAPFPTFTPPLPAGGPLTPIPAAGTVSGFPELDLTKPESATNPRTPFGNVPPIPLPPNIGGVAMQTIINDPTRLLQQAITGQFIESMVVLDIATQATLTFASPTAGAPPVVRPVADGGGGIENIPFLQSNADTALVFATFWIEKVRRAGGHFMQLQYAQTVMLNFPILIPATPPPPGTPPVPFSWPHVSIATLRKTFG
jgi:hypothetical protein